MLETTEDEDASATSNGDTEPTDTAANSDSADDVIAATGTIDDAAVAADTADDWSNEIPDDVAVESNWEDTYPTTAPSSAGSADNDFDFDSRNSREETLQDHLMWQLNLTSMSDTDRIIAIAIIDAVDDNGMLDTSVEELHGSFVTELEIELDEVQAVLHRVQQFDPPRRCYQKPAGVPYGAAAAIAKKHTLVRRGAWRCRSLHAPAGHS